jgi:hypothetical protein
MWIIYFIQWILLVKSDIGRWNLGHIMSDMVLFSSDSEMPACSLKLF